MKAIGEYKIYHIESNSNFFYRLLKLDKIWACLRKNWKSSQRYFEKKKRWYHVVLACTRKYNTVESQRIELLDELFQRDNIGILFLDGMFFQKFNHVDTLIAKQLSGEISEESAE